jgi:hypothetical protein
LTVSKLEKSLILVAAGVTAYSGMPLAADEISDADDLTAVIALQGKPCGKVVNVAKRGEDDYVATCQDGNRYRVYVKDGRVIVEKIG